ncbi:AAA family ATPase [Sutcliffiella halmapala]|uniref:AAA family ATPase n=1 Tax=Sutcliffiella halmapala TaxID=79882 RepID=UPI001F273942|nr:AAA family ATPase [Sutcliffiella halmapala]
MLNGAYGVGKTSVAERLVEIIENAMIFDPEEVGFMLRQLIPENVKLDQEKTDNFQDYILWKTLTVQVAEQIKDTYQKHLIVPMTVFNKEYLQFIRNGFEKIDKDTFHFCLTATQDTIHDRLIERGETEGNWCFQQTTKCLQAFDDEMNEVKIDTEKKSVEELVHEILLTLNQ